MELSAVTFLFKLMVGKINYHVRLRNSCATEMTMK